MIKSQKNIAVIMLHPGCNMACPFCITDEKMTAMDYGQALDLLEVLRERHADTLVLGGGEPFCWQPGVLRLAEEAHRRGFIVQIGTNGAVMPDDYADRPEVDRYVLPLESMDAVLHDAMRPWRGSHHALILDRLQHLAAAGREVTVSTVVQAENRDHLPELAAFLFDYQQRYGRLHAWHLYRFIPAGRGGAQNADRLYIDEAEYQTVCNAVRDLYPEITIYKRRDMRHSETVDFYWQEGSRLCIGSEVWEAEADLIPAGAT